MSTHVLARLDPEEGGREGGDKLASSRSRAQHLPALPPSLPDEYRLERRRPPFSRTRLCLGSSPRRPRQSGTTSASPGSDGGWARQTDRPPWTRTSRTHHLVPQPHSMLTCCPPPLHLISNKPLVLLDTNHVLVAARTSVLPPAFAALVDKVLIHMRSTADTILNKRRSKKYKAFNYPVASDSRGGGFFALLLGISRAYAAVSPPSQLCHPLTPSFLDRFPRSLFPTVDRNIYRRPQARQSRMERVRRFQGGARSLVSSLSSQSPPLSSSTQTADPFLFRRRSIWVSSLVRVWFPKVYDRYVLALAATNGRSLFGIFDLFCINLPSSHKNVKSIFHSDWKNLAMGVCVVVAYGLCHLSSSLLLATSPLADSPPHPSLLLFSGMFNSRKRFFLCLIELKVIIEFPSNCALIYPSALYVHGNLHARDFKVVATEGEDLEWEAVNGKEDRGSMVWFTQANDVMLREMGKMAKDARDAGEDATSQFDMSIFIRD